MRVKLTVSHAEREGDARTYVLEQDPITIGRGGTCDLPLDDPDRVVSKEHAQIRREGDALRVFDLGSKNQTFVNGHRVGTAGIAIGEGDRIQLGPFLVDVAIDRARLVADDLDRTVFGAAFDNPFRETAENLAVALGHLRRAYAGIDYGHRADALADALRDALGPGPDADTLGGLVGGAALAADPSGARRPSAHEAPADPFAPAAPHAYAAPSPPMDPFAPPAAADPFAAFPPTADPFAPAPPAPVPGAMPYAPPAGALPYAPLAPTPPAAPVPPAPAAGPAGGDDVLRVLAAAAARLVSMPGQFRHEFLGHTVLQSPETAFLFDADVEALVRHLAHPEPGERASRHQMLFAATEAVLHHHQGLLEGYRAAVRDGAAALIDAIDPDRLGDDGGGGLMPGARERAALDRIRQRCTELRSDSFAATERRIYRPAFIQAYLDSVARAESLSSPDRPADP